MGHKLTSGRPCDLCGKPIRSDNKNGVCTSNPTCKKENIRRWQLAHPDSARKASREFKQRERLAAPERVRARERLYSQTLNGKAVVLLRGARKRAIDNVLPFDLTREWMEAELAFALENGCPYLGVPIYLDVGPRSRDPRSWNSPSVDRFYPEAGYTQDNCLIVSLKANTMKQDAAPEFVKMLGDNVDLLSRTRFRNIREAAA